MHVGILGSRIEIGNVRMTTLPVRAPPHPQSLSVYETRTGRAVLQCESDAVAVGFCDTKLLVFDATKKALEVWILRDGEVAGSLEQIDPPHSSRGSRKTPDRYRRQLLTEPVTRNLPHDGENSQPLVCLRPDSK
jgi:hypothetical protein